MTRDALKPFPPEIFRLTFDGVKGDRVEATDVLSGAPVPIQARPPGVNKVEVTLAVTDKPILISQSSSPPLCPSRPLSKPSSFGNRTIRRFTPSRRRWRTAPAASCCTGKPLVDPDGARRPFLLAIDVPEKDGHYPVSQVRIR